MSIEFKKNRFKCNLIQRNADFASLSRGITYHVPCTAYSFSLVYIIGPGPQAPCLYTTHMPNPITAKILLPVERGY